MNLMTEQKIIESVEDKNKKHGTKHKENVWPYQEEKHIHS
jgi:hypothetical protein